MTFCPNLPPSTANDAAYFRCYDVLAKSNEAYEAASIATFRDSDAGEWVEFHYTPRFCVDDLVGTIQCYVPKGK